MSRGARYQAAYRLRAAVRGEVIAQGWEELGTLLTFRKDDGEIVVVTKDGQRYSIANAVAYASPSLVEPRQGIETHEFGPRWHKARGAIGKAIADLDLSKTSRADALVTFTDMAAIALRAVQALNEHTGPDWREAIGLGDDDD